MIYRWNSQRNFQFNVAFPQEFQVRFFKEAIPNEMFRAMSRMTPQGILRILEEFLDEF